VDRGYPRSRDGLRGKELEFIYKRDKSKKKENPKRRRQARPQREEQEGEIPQGTEKKNRVI